MWLMWPIHRRMSWWFTERNTDAGCDSESLNSECDAVMAGSTGLTFLEIKKKKNRNIETFCIRMFQNHGQWIVEETEGRPPLTEDSNDTTNDRMFLQN